MAEAFVIEGPVGRGWAREDGIETVAVFVDGDEAMYGFRGELERGLGGRGFGS